ncbi:MAG: hypothetical protein ACI91B_001553 [Planctomycetota bacterium]
MHQQAGEPNAHSHSIVRARSHCYDALEQAKSPEFVGALGVALRLARYVDAAPEMQKPVQAGYLCLGLALMRHQGSREVIQETMAASARRSTLFVQSAIALGVLGDKTAAEELHKKFDHENTNLATLSAIAEALGQIGDRRSIAPLKAAIFNEDRGNLQRAFAAVSLGADADRAMLPWHSKLSKNINYRAAVETLTNQQSGVLDIFEERGRNERAGSLLPPARLRPIRICAMRWLVLPLLLLSAQLVAQRPLRFQGGFGVAGGTYNFDSDLSGFEDNATAGLLLAEFEVTNKKGLGGGFRYEYSITENNEGLFRYPNTAFDEGTQARSSTFLAHATYLIEQHRFRMPVRVGLLVSGLTLDDDGATNPETTYVSVGPFFEIEPEITLVHAGALEWSLYAQLGFGFAGTSIEIDGDSRDYEATTGFGMIEAGTRLHVGPTSFGIAFIGRYQSMDRSDIESGSFIHGYDSNFQGVLISAGFSF